MMRASNISRRLFVLSLCFVFLCESAGWAAEKSKKGYTVTAKSAIFSNSTKVKRLYGKDVHKKVFPASTTKVMTALLVLEKLSMNKWVTVSKRATKAQPTKLYLKPGDQYRVSDLLYAILIKSANDASIVLAEAVSGSEWKFVQLMNERAKELGCRQTKFANSNGLPSKENQYTTAYDMYLIFRAAIKHRFFKKAIGYRSKTIRSKSGKKHRLKTHNTSLWKGWKRDIYGKTGYTKAAKSCFVGYLWSGQDILIIAVFGCTRRWDDVKHIISRYGKIKL